MSHRQLQKFKDAKLKEQKKAQGITSDSSEEEEIVDEEPIETKKSNFTFAGGANLLDLMDNEEEDEPKKDSSEDEKEEKPKQAAKKNKKKKENAKDAEKQKKKEKDNKKKEQISKKKEKDEKDISYLDSVISAQKKSPASQIFENLSQNSLPDFPKTASTYSSTLKFLSDTGSFFRSKFFSFDETNMKTLNPFFEFSNKFGTSGSGMKSFQSSEQKIKKVFRNRIKQFVDEKFKKKKKKGFLNFFDESELSTETMENAFAFPGKMHPGIAFGEVFSNEISSFYSLFQNEDYAHLNETLSNSIIPSLEMDLLVKFLQTKAVSHIPSLMQGFEALYSWNNDEARIFFFRALYNLELVFSTNQNVISSISKGNFFLSYTNSSSHLIFSEQQKQKQQNSAKIEENQREIEEGAFASPLSLFHTLSRRIGLLEKEGAFQTCFNLSKFLLSFTFLYEKFAFLQQNLGKSMTKNQEIEEIDNFCLITKENLDYDQSQHVLIQEIDDPLGILLIFDYYALLSSSFGELLDIIDGFGKLGKANIMENEHLVFFEEAFFKFAPNLMFSTAIATFYLEQQQKHSKDKKKILIPSDLLLQHALSTYPFILTSLLQSICNAPNKSKNSSSSLYDVNSWQNLIHNSIFTNLVCTSKLFSKLMHYYVQKQGDSIWAKDEEILKWLRKNVETILNRDGSSVSTQKFNNLFEEESYFLESKKSLPPKSFYQSLQSQLFQNPNIFDKNYIRKNGDIIEYSEIIHMVPPVSTDLVDRNKIAIKKKPEASNSSRRSRPVITDEDYEDEDAIEIEELALEGEPSADSENRRNMLRNFLSGILPGGLFWETQDVLENQQNQNQNQNPDPDQDEYEDEDDDNEN